MPIPVTCACGKKLNAPDTLAGKRAKCPTCQKLVLIPEPLELIEDEVELLPKSPPKPPASKSQTRSLPANRQPTPIAAQATAPPNPAQSKQSDPTPPVDNQTERFNYLSKKINSAFLKEKIEPVSTPLGYRLAIFAVALLMVVLPLFYLALVASASYGVWYHAFNNTGIIGAISSSGTRASGKTFAFGLMLYLTPILAGALLVLFMLKPLFARAMPHPGRRSLKQSEEPLLFDFVGKVCDAVGSPHPSRIDIDNQVNASASFRSGLRSFFGNDLVLTIGMPLAAGLNLRQFGGVLAHEFGHFAQGAGMRLSYVIRSINFWFDRVVNERDEWDEKLKDWSAALDFRIGWMLYIARFCVWLTRKLLWCLMMIGHFFSGVLMRQMEFDADRHEARFSGGTTFASTARQMLILNLAENGAMSDLGDFHREGRLGDNLPKLILLNVDQMPAELLSHVDEIINDSKTGIFDTHPADSARIQSAQKEDPQGIFRLELPASHLLRDFDQTARQVTSDFYREIFGDELKESAIHEVEGLVERQKVEQKTMGALTRFFQGKPLLSRPMPNPDEATKPVTDTTAVEKRLRDARALALDHAQDFTAASTKFEDLNTRLIETRLAEDLLKFNLPVAKNDFQTDLTTQTTILEFRRKTENRLNNLVQQITPFEASTAARLYSALRLAQAPANQAQLNQQGFSSDELPRLIHLFKLLNTNIPQVQQLLTAKLALEKLSAYLESHADKNDKLLPKFKELVENLADAVADLRAAFTDQPYPFDHGEAGISSAEYILKKLPNVEKPGEVHEAAEALLDRVPMLHARVLARLCQMAEAVETNLGLKPLEDPEKSGSPDSADHGE